MFEYGSGSGGGGGTAGLTRIQQTVVGAAAPSISFLAIPGTYSQLLLHVVGRGDLATASTTPLNMQLNGDTGSNYEWERLDLNAATVAGTNNSGTTTALIGYLPASTATANYVSVTSLWLPGYAVTAFYKSWTSSNFLKIGAGAANSFSDSYGGNWANTAAVTQIVIAPGGGNFLTGTVATLYGLQ